MVRTFAGQEGGLVLLTPSGFVMQRGGSDYSPRWHSILIYGSKRK